MIASRKKLMDTEKRQMLLDQLAFYIQAIAEEQRFRVSNDIPSPDTYWEVRRGSSAVFTYLSLIE